MRSFKEIVNELLRRAFNPAPRRTHRVQFAVRARPMGLKPGLTYDQIAGLIEQLEGPIHR
ncbi:MAG: hypothetical protein ACYCWW_14175 [Deltaproteobacteria bacterium]